MLLLSAAARRSNTNNDGTDSNENAK